MIRHQRCSVILLHDNTIIRLNSCPVAIAQFSKAGTLPGSIAALITFCLFVQSAEGSTFGIVPYHPKRHRHGGRNHTIGAGGNVGAVFSSIKFRQMAYRDAFFWMGLTTSIVSLLLSLFRSRVSTGSYSNNESNLPPQRRRLLLPEEQMQSQS